METVTKKQSQGNSNRPATNEISAKKSSTVEESPDTHIPFGDSDAAEEVSLNQAEMADLIERLTSEEVDFRAVRRYLMLNADDLAELARKKLLVSMNRVTVVELASHLDCYHPERILKGDTSEWLADPVKGPVVETLLEIDHILRSLSHQARSVIERQIAAFRPRKPCPTLPCSLLRILRYVTITDDHRIKDKFLEQTFIEYAESLSDFPPGEPFRLCTAVKAGLPFPSEKSRPGGNPSKGAKAPKGSKDLMAQFRVQSMAVTDSATVGWLLGDFRELWLENLAVIRNENTSELQKDAVNLGKKAEGSAGSNKSQELAKWTRITKAYVEFHVGKDSPVTREEHESLLKNFAKTANKIDPEIENGRSPTRQKIRVFLDTLMNHCAENPDAAAEVLFEKLRMNKKPVFKSDLKDAIKECWKELDEAGLICEFP